MRRIAYIALSVLLLITGGAFSARAAERPNILIIGLDADEQGADTQTIAVARDTRVFNRVLDAISSEIRDAGFNTFDERAVAALNIAQNSLPRSAAEMAVIARAMQHPSIDVVVFFTIYAGTRKLAYTTDVYVRIFDQVLNIRTGERLGGFEVTSPKGWRAPVNCARECLVEAIGENAKMLTADLGNGLGK